MNRKRSLITVVITTFLIFNVISIVVSTYYIKTEGTNTSLNYAKESMLEIVEEKSELISIKFDRLKTNVKTVGALVEEKLDNEENSFQIPDDYIINEKGIVTRKKNQNKNEKSQSNVLATCDTDNLSSVARDIAITETMDTPMSSILENEDVIWGYIVTENNFLRVSPYLSLDKYFDDNHKQNEDIFYTMADADHNPEKESIITKPYNDYLGAGWTVTCSQPVYDSEGNMFGVVCLDVSISEMANELFADFSLGNSGKIVWLSSNGNIYFHSEYAQSSTIQGEIFEKNIFELADIGESEKTAFRQALESGSGITTFSSDEDNSQIMVYSQIEDMDSYLILQMNMNEFMPSTHVNFKGMWLIVFLDGTLALFFAVFLHNRVSKPMKNLIYRADCISQGDYKEVEIGSKNDYYEIATLNEAFSTMSRNITLNILAEKEMRQMEKMAGVGQLSAAIVHELKNVFARIKGALYIIDMTKKTADNDEELETINVAVKEAEDIITALLDFSKENRTENSTNVASIINQILLLSNKDIISHNIEVSLSLQDNCIIYSNEIEAVKVILQNLIINAIQAIGQDGHIGITLYSKGNSICIKVRDDGPGISIEPKEKIFEPFVTTKEDGSGIGLWITKRLTEALGGAIKVSSRPGDTEFIIRIPIERKEKDGEQDIIGR